MKRMVSWSKFLAVLSYLFFYLNVFLPVVSGAHPLGNWHLRDPLPQGNRLNGVTYGKNTFLAVGASGTIVTSGDSVNWTARSSGSTYTLYGVAYGKDTFVAVGNFGTIVTSGDGK